MKKLLFIIFLIFCSSIPVFAEGEVASEEFIFPPQLFANAHSPSIAESPDGELFAVWYATWNPPGSIIWGSRKPAGAKKWMRPVIIHRDPKYPCKNPVLYLGDDKKLRLFWADEKKLLFKIIRDVLRMKVSEDFGRTWDEPRGKKVLSWFLPRTNPIRLNNGDLLLPVYTDLSTSSAVIISKDGGLTWKGPNYILFFLGIQPTIIQRSDSSLFALMRTGMWPRLSWQAVSNDSGRTWKNTKLSNVNNPGSSLEMIKLKSGNVVMVFHDTKKKRETLSIALSYDDGKTWAHTKPINSKDTGLNMYPSIIQDKEGLIHVVYASNNRTGITHFVTNEKWIEGK